MPRPHPLIAALALAALVLALLAGCGGDDDDTTAASGSNASNTTATNDAANDTTSDDSAGSDQTGDEESTEDSESDSADGGEAPAPPATKAEFIKKADALCVETGKELRAQATAFFEGTKGVDRASPEELEGLTNEVVVPGLQAQISELRGLGPPPAGAAEMETLLLAMETEIEHVGDNATEVLVAGNPYTESEKLAKNYGLKVCGGYP